MAQGNVWRRVFGVLAVAWLAILFAGSVRAADGPGARLVIAGTGDSEEMLRNLASRFMREHPDVAVEVPESIGSSGGVKAVLAGKAELARLARPLRDEEKAAGLTETVFATAPVVFAVHPSVTGVENLTTAQALAIFSGAVTDWSALGGPPGPIRRVCRKTPETSRDLLNAAIPGFAALDCNDQAVAYSTPEAVELVARHPGAIGYFTLPSTVMAKLRPLSLDGVLPSTENLARAAYPLSVPFSLAYKPPLSPAAARFVAALGLPDARTLMAKFGCLPGAGKAAAP